MNRIREIRENKNVSQGDVAKALNVAPHTINQYEKGRWVPTLGTWDKLADYFDVSIEYLQGYVLYAMRTSS
ncbi:MAG: helix-turn-helix domain-containing protein [Acinetobacter sp.]|nr:helix-turn-helix domain-containing protein [Acinetobacter sp.]